MTGDHRSFPGHLEAQLILLQVFLFKAFMLQLRKACMNCHVLPLTNREAPLGLMGSVGRKNRFTNRRDE